MLSTVDIKYLQWSPCCSWIRTDSYQVVLRNISCYNDQYYCLTPAWPETIAAVTLCDGCAQTQGSHTLPPLHPPHQHLRHLPPQQENSQCAQDIPGDTAEADQCDPVWHWLRWHWSSSPQPWPSVPLIARIHHQCSSWISWSQQTSSIIVIIVIIVTRGWTSSGVSSGCRWEMIW